MTYAPANPRSRIALALGAIMLLSTTLPLASVLGANEPGSLDDLVVLVTPRHSTLVGDNQVAMASTSNMFVFDFELRHADGSPYVVTQYYVDIHTVDGRADPDADWPTLIWSGKFSTAPTYKGTVRVPASEVVHFTPKDHNGYHHEFPFGGMSFTLLATKDAQGRSLLDGSYPAGSYSLLANNLYAQGVRGDQLDRADEGFTPLLLFSTQLSGLTQFGNPVLNPGFEVGFEDMGDLYPDVGPIPGFRSALPPWVMLRNDAETPATTSHIQGAAGKAGSAVSIRYNTADNGHGTSFGQLFFVPGANSPGPWVGTDDVKIVFDMRARDEAGVMTSPFHGATTLHWADAACTNGECQLTKGPAGGVALDNTWRTYTLNFGNVADGKQLNSFFFSFLLTNAQAPAGSALVVQIDNVRITGAEIAGGATTLRSDLTDGFSTFITPAFGRATRAVETAQVLLTTLANGEEAYVFRVSAMDYRGIDPLPVHLDASAKNVFQLLDENFVPDLSHDPNAVAYHAEVGGLNGNTIYNVLNPDGTLGDDLIVVVPADTAGNSLVPWFWSDVATDDLYTSTFGWESEPVSAFYSVARNNMRFSHLADSMDYDFTVLRFVNEVGGSVASATTIAIDCPSQAHNVPCASVPNPVLDITVSTESDIVETIGVEIVAPSLVGNDAFPGGVVATGSVLSPGGVASITLSDSVMENLTASGNMAVIARTADAAFASPAETLPFELDNFKPVAQFLNTPVNNLFKRSTVTFTDTSTDSDGTIVDRLWTVDLVGDSTPDGDADAVGLVQSSAARSFNFVVPDDGHYMVTLVVTDDGGASASKVLHLNASNRAPTAVINGPLFAMPGDALTFTYALNDADGIPGANHEVFDGTAWLPRAAAPAPILAMFTVPGTYDIRVNATDNDGAWTIVTHQILIEETAPETTITAPAAPTSGWFTGDDVPVAFTVARTDAGGSGIATTTIAVASNGNAAAVETVNGDDDLDRELSADGVHVITAFSKDKAGNVGAVVSHTIKIDRSAPTVELVSPQLLDGAAPIAGVFFTDQQVDIEADAIDAQSGVVKVAFFDGETLIGIDSDASDGWSIVWTANESGTHEINAIATNAAGLSSISQPISVLVI